MLRKAFILFFLFIANSFSGELKNEDPKLDFGFSVGWNNPVGAGIEASIYPISRFSIDVGAGLSLSGPKLSFGLKKRFEINRPVMPFIGLAFSSTSGMDELRLNVNTDTAFYKLYPTKMISARVGLIYMLKKIDVFGTLGYVGLIDGGEVEYLEGDMSESVNNFAKMANGGGIEISAGLKFRFMGRKEKKLVYE